MKLNDDFNEDLRRMYMERMMGKYIDGFDVDIHRAYRVISEKIVPDFKRTIKHPWDFNIDKITNWIQGLFTPESKMQVIRSMVVVDDNKATVTVFALFKYKSATVPMLLLCKGSPPEREKW